MNIGISKFLIALSTFAVGTFIAGAFAPRPDSVPNPAGTEASLERIDRDQPNDVIDRAGATTTDDRRQMFDCGSPESNSVFSELRKVREIAEAFALESRDFHCSQQLRLTEVDLNADGKLEVIASLYLGGLCGSKGNCPLAIYARTPKGYRRLLYSSAAQSFEVLAATNNDYRDVQLNFGLGVYGCYETVFRFHGRSYRRHACHDHEPDGKRSRASCRSLGI